MDKILFIVFGDERRAYEGSEALKELDAEGSISLYAMAVIAKDASGNVTVKQAADRGPLGTAVGLITGSLIGLLGGPAGVVVGAVAGGTLIDLATVGVGEDFLDEAEQHLQPGKAAVVAEVQEEWVMPVDTRMLAAGGVVYRRARGQALNALVKSDVAAFKAEAAELNAEQERAAGAAKTNLQAKIDAANARLEASQDRARAAFQAAKQEREAKIKSLEEQATRVQGEAKARVVARIAKAKVENAKLAEMMGEAWEGLVV